MLGTCLHSGPSALSRKLWRGWGGVLGTAPRLAPCLSWHPAPTSILMSKGNLGFLRLERRLPMESGGAETRVPGVRPATIVPLVGGYTWQVHVGASLLLKASCGWSKHPGHLLS